MKTAIQEMIERLEKSGFFLISYDYDIFNEALEKEKEQLEIAFDLGRDEVTSVFIIDGEDYYNKKFNQNK